MVSSPWLDIPLEDYEGHMALPEIAPARMLADELESAVRQHAPSSVAIIGCSGGNGFERLMYCEDLLKRPIPGAQNG